MLPPALPLAAPPACVVVVVDYGTASGAPAGPNLHCTGSATGDIAAEVLARRRAELGSAAPRYQGNFLCAIDGYPESGCGDHGTEPYWSFWVWTGGKWSYSQLGVDSYTTGDSDRDGCTDPLGFRYHAFEQKAAPRRTPPSCATQPPATSPPPQKPPASSAPGSSPAGGAATTRPAGGAPTTTAAAVPAAGLPGTSPPAVATSSPGPDAPAASTTPPGIAAPSGSTGFPVTTAVAGLGALALIGATAVRLRRTP